MLKGFLHVERMGEERLVERVYRANMRPRRRWRDEVKDLPLERGLSEREGMVLARDREAWGGKVYISV